MFLRHTTTEYISYTELNKKRLLFSVLMIIFFISFSDSLLSYLTPIFLEKHLGNSMMMGIILSTSSCAGLLFDFVVGSRYKKKGYVFFLKYGILFALAFPLALALFPKHIVFFVIAMIIWGTYYELIAFTKFRYIEKNYRKDDYTYTWGVFMVIAAIAYVLGPAVASLLIEYNVLSIFFLSIFITSIALILFLKLNLSDNLHNTSQNDQEKRQLKLEFGVWKTLMTKLHFIWVLAFVTGILDATFWTVGILYAENLKHTSPIGSLFFLLYILPSTYIGIFAGKHKQFKMGKKRITFITTGLAGLLIFITGFDLKFLHLLALVFVAANFRAYAFPTLSATFEDYIKRAGYFKNDLIGLEQSATSVAYIVGPIIAGALGLFIGYQYTIALAGLLVFITSALCYVFVPRKIKLPQKDLHSYILHPVK